ncbi:hypothetical protein ABLE92_01920 [Gordonia sp. VNQ95]|uniref:hypothetical protein n=1 Tax=Gordonia sp. VNQ95 TaxID=3156619 RepID=UPI0032B49ABC
MIVGIAVAVAAVVSTGCATSDSAGPQSTVTVYASPSSSSTSSSAYASSPSSVTPASNQALAASFRRVASGTGLTVGVAVAPVGGASRPTITLGDLTPGVAWSTIKVPLAVAAERENGESASESNAIINSDNASAEALWASLGSNEEASRKVTAVLREGGNPNVVVPSVQQRAGFTIFGQTVWTLPAAATFVGHLPCMPGTEHVVSLMGQVAGNQQWGVEVMRLPKATAVKGGWGPGVDGSYLVRQIGLITYRSGEQSAVAMSAVGGSMSGGIAALNAIGNWLNANIAALPRGRC